jgi:hypothetical protein
MSVRFLADADLNRAIIAGILRVEPSLDFRTAQSANLRRLKDTQVLALAAEEGRVLVSHAFGTMPRHFRGYREAGRQSGGVVLIPQTLDIGTAIEELHMIWVASDAEEWRDRLEWLPLW